MTLSYRNNFVLLIMLLLFPSTCVFALEGNSTIVTIDDLNELDSLTNSADTQSITLSAGDRDYTLVLQLSDIAQNIQAKQMSKLQGVQFFMGTVVGDDRSWVRLSRNNGNLSGYLKAFGQLIKLSSTNSLEYAVKTVNPKDPLLVSHGLDRVLTAPTLPNLQSKKFLNNTLLHTSSNNYHAVERVLQISIVVDSRFNDFYNGNGLAQAISVINGIDGLYQEQFGLGVQLESAISLDADNDPFLHLNGNIETVLREFRLYTLDNIALTKDVGLLHLFSGTYDDNKTIGLSWIDTVCRTDGYNVSLSVPFPNAQMILAAHEMAHNLGAQHDDNHSCDLEYDKIMWPSISKNTGHEFSDCSKNTINQSLSASCNLDNIDLEIALELTSNQQQNQSRLVRLTIENNDLYLTAKNVNSITHLSDNLVLNNLPTNCSYFNKTLSCTHGSVALAAGKQVTLDLDVIGSGDQLINTELAFTEFADLTSLNNYASINLKTDNPNKEQPNNEIDTQISSGSGGSGAGGTGFFLIVILWISIKSKYQRKQN